LTVNSQIEYPHDEDGPGLAAANGAVVTRYSEDDPDVAAAELAEELDGGMPAPADDHMIVVAAKTEAAAARAEEVAAALRAHEAARVHRKVSAGVAGGTVIGGIPALLASIQALELPPRIEPFVLVAATLIGAFSLGWFAPQRAPRI
jgi:hypothetical protein